ncbi:hypothetical protein M422DRAFT_781902, partial [Sphaerobolus stellatus SS14]
MSDSERLIVGGGESQNGNRHSDSHADSVRMRIRISVGLLYYQTIHADKDSFGGVVEVTSHFDAFPPLSKKDEQAIFGSLKGARNAVYSSSEYLKSTQQATYLIVSYNTTHSTMLVYTVPSYPTHTPRVVYSNPHYTSPQQFVETEEQQLRNYIEAAASRQYLAHIEEQRVLANRRRQEALRQAEYQRREAFAARYGIAPGGRHGYVPHGQLPFRQQRAPVVVIPNFEEEEERNVEDYVGN